MRHCSIGGVKAGSALANALATAAGDRATLGWDDTAPVVSEAWERLVAGSALYWQAADGKPSAPRSGPAEIVLDLWGTSGVIDQGKRHWRVVDARGAAVLTPFLWARASFAAPFFLSLYLVEEGGAGAMVLAEAHLGNRLGLTDLLSVVAATCGTLLRHALDRDPTSPTVPFAPTGPAPRPFDTLSGAFALGGAALRRSLSRWSDRVFSETWAIGTAQPDLRRLLADVREGGVVSSRDLGPIGWIASPDPDRYLADPFFWPGRPETILCEAFSYVTGLGSLIALDRGEERTIETRFDCHLSYPFTWVEHGEVFLLPESGASRETALFRLGGDGVAERVATIAEDRAMADSTLFKHEGRYWIAFTDMDIPGQNNLSLLSSVSLMGPWSPHRRNPVKIDVRSSRPGGTPFVVDGVLYRPAQDCAATYGAALAINRVTRCDPEGYEERCVLTIRPDAASPYPDGLHTFTVGGPDGKILVDGKRFVVNWRELLRKLRRRL